MASAWAVRARVLLIEIGVRHVDFGAVVLASAAASGLRILGLFSQQRNPSVPDTPTVRELGYDVARFSIGGLSAPAGLPPNLKLKLEQACKVAAHSEAYARLMKTLHQPTDYYAAGDDYANALAQDFATAARAIGNDQGASAHAL